MINAPLHVLIIMLLFNIVAIYKDWIVNKKMFETYRSSKTGDPTIDPLNGIPEDQLEKEQCSPDSIDRRLFVSVSEIWSDTDSNMTHII